MRRAQRLEAFRALRAEAEAAILPLARSVDGRSFAFQSKLDGLELRLGGYVMLEGGGGRRRSARCARSTRSEIDAGEVGLAGDGAGAFDVRARLPLRVARGEGVILDGGGTPFNDRMVTAGHAGRGRCLARTHRADARAARGRERCRSPTECLSASTPAASTATPSCAASRARARATRSGCTLEQLLLETQLRIIVIDPNSDFVRLPEVRDDAEDGARRALARRSPARSPSARPSCRGDGRLRLRFGQLEPEAQAGLLRLDPIADREEYAEFAALAEEAAPQELTDLATAERRGGARLIERVTNLGVARWGVWAREDPGSLFDAIDDPSLRMVVVDVGSLATREEQALVAESVLGHLWQRRARREPVLLVIDEAHNVCPREPDDPLTALATEHAVRIAGEGRKFGIYMLVASQRPAKVHENVLSQCDNLVLMRLNSAADAALIAELLGFVPPALISLATDFRLGEALVAGKLASHPTIMRFGRRVAQEGGTDVAADWAAR